MCTLLHTQWVLLLQRRPVMDASSSLPISLKRRWWWTVAVFGLTFLGGYVAMYLAWHPSRAGYWGIGASSALVYLLGYTRAYLPLNRAHPDGTILPHLGIGNQLTLFRGLLFGLLAGFLVLPPLTGLWAWVPGILYTVASLTDLLDGRLARKHDQTTDLGARLDVEVDSLGILVAFILGVNLGQLPVYFAYAGLLFYGYRVFLWGWKRAGGSITAAPHRRWRSMVGGFEVGFLCVMLFPIFKPPLTTAVGLSIVLPVIASFLWDGLITTGAIRVGSRWHQRAVALLSRWGRHYLPVVLHLVLGAGIGWFLIAELQPPDHSLASVSQYMLLGGLALSVGLSIVDVGRWKSALVILMTAAFLSLLAGISPPQIMITTAGFLLLLTRLGNRNSTNSNPVGSSN